MQSKTYNPFANAFNIPVAPSVYDVQKRQDIAKRLLDNSNQYVANSGFIGALGETLAGAGGGYELGSAAQEAQQGLDESRKNLGAALLGTDPSALIQAAGDPFLPQAEASQGSQMAFARMTPGYGKIPPIVSQPGDILRDPFTYQPIDGTDTGAFDGSQKGAVNLLIRANTPGADPALKQSAGYRAAWAVATQPTMTPQGMIQPAYPPEWAPASGAQTVAAPAGNGMSSTGGQQPATAGVPQGSNVAPIGAMANAPQGNFQSVAGAQPPTLAPGVIPNSQPYNQSQARTNSLIQSAVPDLKRVVDNFPALINTKDQLLQHGGTIGRVFQDPAYKQAHDALTASIGNILYVASGANLNAGELARKVEAYTPALGDDAKTAANKLDRFANDVMVYANSTKDPDTIAWANQALQELQATRDQILNGNKAAPQTSGKAVTIDGVTIEQVSP